jgi:uncharacterized protein YndB with AHSA1/START domain
MSETNDNVKTRNVVVTRVFDAPVEQVWRAWTDPQQVMRWWGPAGFTSPVAKMDVREGGTSLVCMRAPSELGGQDIYNTWTYHKIIPNEHCVLVWWYIRDREGGSESTCPCEPSGSNKKDLPPLIGNGLIAPW